MYMKPSYGGTHVCNIIVPTLNFKTSCLLRRMPSHCRHFTIVFATLLFTVTFSTHLGTSFLTIFISECLISLFQGDVVCQNFTLKRPLYILAVAINTKYTLSSAPSSKIVSLTLAPAPITTLLPTDTLGPSWKRIVTARIKLTGLHLTSVSSLVWPKI